MTIVIKDVEQIELSNQSDMLSIKNRTHDTVIFYRIVTWLIVTYLVELIR